MNTNQLLTELSFGELSTLSLSNEGDGTIRKSDYGKMLAFINDALQVFHNRFKINEKVVIVELNEYTTTYHLLPRFAVSQQPQEDVIFAYVRDLPHSPFKGDVNKIIAVWDSEGNERAINDEAKENSIFIMQKNSFTVPNPVNGIQLYIHYLPAPIPITRDNLDMELDIPDVIIPALKAYIASKVFMSIGSNDSIRLSHEYQSRYLLMVNELQATDITSGSRHIENPFEDRGWI